nr:SDR family NAD(P)-dependent oxidoreductase [Pantoea sp. 201603H]
MPSNMMLTSLVPQRVNRAALPHMRRHGQGLLVWISSSSSAGGTPPYLAPYFAAKAAMDELAVLYARELSRWGIETTIIVPGAFTKGTNHFAHSGRPADEARLAEYEAGPYAGFGEQVQQAFARIVPDDADVGGVADAGCRGGRFAVWQTPVPRTPMILPRTVRKLVLWCWTVCVQRCYIGLASAICSNLMSAVNHNCCSNPLSL